GIGKVLEFAGDDLKNWSMDERATLTNMAVEAGGTTGIIEPDEVTLEYVVRIDAAYGGSCTGGKMADMDMYAMVLESALAHGKRVAEGVHLYIQFGSQKIKQYARQRGYIDIFERAGAELIDPSCGAC